MRAVLLVLAFVYQFAGAAEPNYAQVRATDEFIDQYLPLFGKSLASIRRMGKVQRETSKVIANRHEDGVKDEQRTIRFGGLVVHTLVPGRDPKFALIESIEVLSPAWQLPKGLRVGSSVDAVLKVFGEPSSSNWSLLGYEGSNDRVGFHIKDGQVTKVIFDLYTD